MTFPKFYFLQVKRFLSNFKKLEGNFLFMAKRKKNGIANDTSVGRTERVGLMSEQNQNLASNHSKKYTYRSEPKQISFRVSESEFAKLKQSAEDLQMSVPAFVKAKAQNARLVTPKVAPDIAQAIARDLAKAGGNINQIAKWCNTHQHDVTRRRKRNKETTCFSCSLMLLSPDTVRILVSMGRLKWYFISPIYSFLLVF